MKKLEYIEIYRNFIRPDSFYFLIKNTLYTIYFPIIGIEINAVYCNKLAVFSDLVFNSDGDLIKDRGFEDHPYTAFNCLVNNEVIDITNLTSFEIDTILENIINPVRHMTFNITDVLK